MHAAGTQLVGIGSVQKIEAVQSSDVWICVVKLNVNFFT
jgi:hypothetical protein